MKMGNERIEMHVELCTLLIFISSHTLMILLLRHGSRDM